MFKEYSSKNGFYKYYNKEGKSCRIFVDKDAINLKDQRIILSWTSPNTDGWNVYIPHTKKGEDKKFKNIFEVIKHILKNLETDKSIFKVSVSFLNLENS